MNPVRTAIIGTGSSDNAHMRAVREMGERVRLVATVDIDRERVEQYANEYDVPYRYTDAAEMLAVREPRLVLIATPPGTHTDLIIQSLEAGAWVLCEKPLCGSLAELDRIATVEARTGNY